MASRTKRRAAVVYRDDANGMPQALTLAQIAEETFATSLHADRRLRVCRNCDPQGFFYREIDNVGRLGCRYHPGTVVNGVYACCGYPIDAQLRTVSRNMQGCVPCDHTLPQTDTAHEPRWTPATMTQRLPLHLLHLYAPHDDLVLERVNNAAAPERSYVLVLRVDPVFYASRDDGWGLACPE